jgi:CRP-like cAMP-binding protein
MNDSLEILKSSVLFNEINYNDLEALLKCLESKIKTYEKDQIIMMEEDIPKMGVILSGSAQIIKEDFNGNKTIIDKIEKSGLFGETVVCAEIDKSPVTVIAEDECRVIFINYKRIITPCESSCSFHKKLIENMLKIIAGKNIMLNRRIQLISARSTREKLLSFLLSEKEKAGKSSFEISFDRNELADFLCVERSAMSRELGKLRDENIIKFNKNKFEIL